MSENSYAPASDAMSRMHRRFSTYTEESGAFSRQPSAADDRRAHEDDEGENMSEHLFEQLVNSKIETVQARLDGNVQVIRGEIQALGATLQASIQNNNDRLTALDQQVRESSQAVKGLKTTIIVTAVATALAIAALNGTIFSNMVASFESGKNTAKDQAEVKRQSEETAALIKQLQAQVAKPSETNDPKK